MTVVRAASRRLVGTAARSGSSACAGECLAQPHNRPASRQSTTPVITPVVSWTSLAMSSGALCDAAAVEDRRCGVGASARCSTGVTRKLRKPDRPSRPDGGASPEGASRRGYCGITSSLTRRFACRTMLPLERSEPSSAGSVVIFHRNILAGTVSPPAERMLWGGGRGWQFRRLHQSMECRDAPAERFEQVPRCPGPR